MKNITLSADAHLIEAARQRTYHPERQVSRLAGSAMATIKDPFRT